MSDTIERILGIKVTKGRQAPPDLFSEDDRKALAEIRAKPRGEAGARLARPYVPSDPARPWLDPVVQVSAQRFLREVVLPDWTTNHPHKNCSGIRVDEWGRLLCRYISPTNGVDGPWQNPTHFLFYAYNTYQSFKYYGITLNGFLITFCNIQLP